jgi:hypothetical protein
MESNKHAENRIDTSEYKSQSLFGRPRKLETEREAERNKKQALKNTYKERMQT